MTHKISDALAEKLFDPDAELTTEELIAIGVPEERARNLEKIKNMSSQEFFETMDKIKDGNPYAEEMVRRAIEKGLYVRK